jgi:hypothetical protein
MQQLLLQFRRSSEGRVQRLLQFLSAQGYKQQWELVEQELRDCLMQLSGILNIAQFASQVGTSFRSGRVGRHAHEPVYFTAVA